MSGFAFEHVAAGAGEPARHRAHGADARRHPARDRRVPAARPRRRDRGRAGPPAVRQVRRLLLHAAPGAAVHGAGLRVRRAGRARQVPLRGRGRPVRQRGPGRLRHARLDRRPAMVERQGRDVRRLLLRLHAVGVRGERASRAARDLPARDRRRRRRGAAARLGRGGAAADGRVPGPALGRPRRLPLRDRLDAAAAARRVRADLGGARRALARVRPVLSAPRAAAPLPDRAPVRGAPGADAADHGLVRQHRAVAVERPGAARAAAGLVADAVPPHRRRRPRDLSPRRHADHAGDRPRRQPGRAGRAAAPLRRAGARVLRGVPARGARRRLAAARALAPRPRRLEERRAMAATGCGDPDPVPVPRRRALPGGARRGGCHVDARPRGPRPLQGRQPVRVPARLPRRARLRRARRTCSRSARRRRRGPSSSPARSSCTPWCARPARRWTCSPGCSTSRPTARRATSRAARSTSSRPARTRPCASRSATPGYLLRPGHGLRLHLAGSDFPEFVPSPGTGENPWLARETRTNEHTIRLGGEVPARLSITVLP